MLSYLRIKNFALMDDVELSLGPQMNVITGETGAGKSMLLQAVSLLRGGRASTDWVRAGAEEARIEAVFVPKEGHPAGEDLGRRLQAANIEVPRLYEEGLCIRRILGAKGRNRIYLGDHLVSTTMLEEICGELIELSSQHEHQTLMEVQSHLGILDRSGVPKDLLEQMEKAYQRLKQATTAYQTTLLEEHNRSQREDFLRFQLKELTDAKVQPGEEEALRQERERLRALEKLKQVASQGEYVLFSREGSVLADVERIQRELGALAHIEPGFVQLHSQMKDAQALIEDVARELRKYLQSLAASPGRLEEIESRLHLLSKLYRKYGNNEANLLAKQAQFEEELSAFIGYEERRSALEKELDQAKEFAISKARTLSEHRKKVAEELSNKATKALRLLAMPHAQILVDVGVRLAKEGDELAYLFEDQDESKMRIGMTGWDRCELLFAANLGSELRPLQKIASGGELSRILLALKRVLGQADSVPTHVFDEIDTGIGGAVADQVGKQLKALSQEKQLLCITHLPQIAAYADTHFVVEKLIEQNETRTQVRQLNEKERQEEIARMLGGSKVTTHIRAHAKELLRDTQTSS